MHGKVTEEMKYVADFRIASYHVDMNQRLKPSAFMDLAQEIAYLNSNAMHFGFSDLSQNNVVWVLSRMQIRFLRLPEWGEHVTLQTWYKGAMSLFCMRDFCMTDDEGNHLVEATTLWAVIDMDTRKMVRGEEMNKIISDRSVCSDSVIEEPAPKVIIPKDLATDIIVNHEVAYSDIDVVGHTNNARYLVWAMDSMDYATVAGQPLREVSINFSHETKAGDMVTITRQHDDKAYYVAGQVDGRQAFAIEMRY